MKYLHLTFILFTAALLASCAPYGWPGGSTPGSFDSNGERIYFTATSNSGDRISYSDGIPVMHGGIACVNCHGPEGKGGRVRMMMWSFETPDITWGTLTAADHEETETGNGHDEHPPYTEESVKEAITRGVDPAGESLDDNMPRWRMSDEDLDDLVEFLKTL